MNTLNTFVGIDNSHSSHSVVILDENGKLVKRFSISNDMEGFNQLHDHLTEFKNVRIGFEISHGPLIDYLRNKNYCIYSINPLKIKRFKETHTVSGNKNDDIDALAIGMYLKANYERLSTMIFNSPEIEELKYYCTIHEQLTVEHTRLTNQLADTLKLYFPLCAHLFSSFSVPILSHFIIKYPTWNDLKNTTDEDLKKFLFKLHYPGKDIKKLLEKIKKHDQTISPDVEKAYSFKARVLACNLLTLKKGLKDIEEKMIEITENHRLGNVFLSLPGSGSKLAPKMLASFGDNKTRFSGYNNAQCFFGTAPKNYQSGKIHKVIMRKACNKQTRHTFYQFAFTSLTFSEWARAYYDDQKKKGKSHSMACRALSNKWVKIIYFLWLREELYSENKRLSPFLSDVA